MKLHLWTINLRRNHDAWWTADRLATWAEAMSLQGDPRIRWEPRPIGLLELNLMYITILICGLCRDEAVSA